MDLTCTDGDDGPTPSFAKGRLIPTSFVARCPSCEHDKEIELEWCDDRVFVGLFDQFHQCTECDQLFEVPAAVRFTEIADG